MPKFKIDFTHHHNSDRSDCATMIEASDRQDAVIKAFQYGIESNCGVMPSLKQLATAIEQLKDNEYVTINVVNQQYPDESYQYVLWNGNDNTGFGQTSNGSIDGTYRSENVWIVVNEWEPLQERRDELLAKSMEELVDMIMQMEATC